MSWKLLQGDCIERLRELEPESAQTCVTSPPYWGLRNYGVEGQLGLEKHPDQYVERLVEIFRSIRRALRPDGTVWLNLGDSYATGIGQGLRMGGKKFGKHNEVIEAGCYPVTQPNRLRLDGLKAKDLIGIPWRVALALQADGWWLRSDIIWSKKNCIPESVEDRPTLSHEYIFLLSKSKRYYYDFRAIKEPCQSDNYDKSRMKVGRDRLGGKFSNQDESRLAVNSRSNIGRRAKVGDGELRNKRTVWSVALQPFRGAHFATFPPKLIEPCILAGAPEGGTVLDPFAGSGTTLLVARQLRRNAIGIELNPEYVKMAEARIIKQEGLFA